jgi:ADP-heptose:LPS heptosyltransferase
MRSRLAGLPADARVSVVRVGGLGDTILVLPALEILRAAHPDATFTLIGSAWAEALQPLLPPAVCAVHIDRVFPAPRRGGPSADAFAASSAVIVYTATPESELVAHARGACPGPVRVWPVAPPAGTHAARHLANAVAAAPDGSDVVPIPVLRCPPEDGIQARRWLDRRLGRGIRPVAVHPGSGGRWKCWPAPRFAALAAGLQVPLLVVEGPADSDACRALVGALPASVPAVRAAGVPLLRLAALLAESRGLLGNDSGVSHLAAALGVPTVAVFGPTDPAVWAPLGSNVSVVRARGEAAWPTVDEALAAARTRFDAGARSTDA